MKTLLTDSAIRYTWDQVFYRLGITPDESGFSVSGKRITFQYNSVTRKEIPPGQFLLSILPCAPDAYERLMNDPALKLTWLDKEEFLPNLSLEFPVEKLPVLIWGESSSKNRFAEIESGTHLVIHVDLIASMFFMLSRLEEYNSRISDRHGRYPYSESAACRHEFIDLPIVDFYVKLLKYWLEALTQEKIPDRHQFRISLSHDIDYISLFRPALKGIATLAKDALKFKMNHLRDDFGILFNSYRKDPYFSGIKLLAERSAEFGFSSTFNIMATSPSIYDAGYSLTSPIAREMLGLLANKGHQIGLHASYLSFGNPDRITKEKFELEKLTKGQVDIIRSHYLRLKTPESWKTWQTAGFKRDTSYGFSEHEGFKCGTCFPYQTFDIAEDKPLDLIEEPLIVMDTTLKSYRMLALPKAKEAIIRLAGICKFVGGNFAFLWHNTSFFRDWQDWGKAYPEILSLLRSLLSNG